MKHSLSHNDLNRRRLMASTCNTTICSTISRSFFNNQERGIKMLFSVFLILFLGFLSNKLFQRLKIPGMLGMILVGMGIGPYVSNLISKDVLQISKDIRMLALIIILLRAGLGLNKDSLKQVGKVAIKMAALPCLIEGFTIMAAVHFVFGLPLAEAGMLGFIIAAVSPAVVVPSMLDLKERKLGIKEGVPEVILAGASIDDVFAITLFGAFLSMGTLKGQGSLGKQIAMIPIEILGGVLLGILFGYILYFYFKRYKGKHKPAEELLLFFIAAIAMTWLGDKIHVAGLLAVMTAGFIFVEKDRSYGEKMAKGFNHMWGFAEIFLFVLIGAEVNIQVAVHAGLLGILVIFIGLIGRALGVFISMAGSHFNAKERLFCCIAYLPKATVQAAIGGIPLAAGVASGELILATAVLAILVTAPLGAIGIKITAPKLLNKVI